MEKRVNILYYWRMLWKWKVFILTVAVIFTIVYQTTQMKREKFYETKAMFLFSEKKGGASISFSGINGPSMLSTDNPTKTIIFTLVYSKRMSKDIVKEFNLQEVFGIESIDNCAAKVRSMIRVGDIEDIMRATGGGVLRVRGQDPQLIADITNFILSNLDKINEELKIYTIKPLVKVVDPAVVPTRIKYREKSSLLFTIAIGFSIAILLSFFIEYILELKMEESGESKKEKGYQFSREL